MLRSARFDRIVKKKSLSLSLKRYNGGNNDGDPPPFRTEKLSPLVPMVLLNQVGE